MPNALILVNSDAEFEREVVNFIEKEVAGVEFVLRVHGVYDHIIRISAPTDDELKNAILAVRKHRFVKSTSTLLVREKR